MIRKLPARVVWGGLVATVCAIYPTFVFSTVLFWETDTRLGTEPSDIDGTLRTVQQVSHDGLLASCSNWDGFPSCVNLISPGWLSHYIHLFSFNLLTSIFPPQLSLNIFLFLGFFSSGAVTYLICRQLRCPRALSLIAGPVVQALPWMREKLAEHVSYVYLSIPLLSIALSLALIKSPSWPRLLRAIAVVMATSFFDLYWFYFSFTALLFAAFFIPESEKTVNNKYQILKICRRNLLIGLWFQFLIWSALAWVVSSWDRFNLRVERQLGIADEEFVASFSGSIFDYIFPRHIATLLDVGSYDPGRGSDNISPLGITLIVLALVGLVSHWASRQFRYLGTVSVFYLILSLGKIDTPIVDIPPINSFFRFIFPGMRVFLRSGLLAEAILCILSLFGFMRIIKSVSLRWKQITASILILSAIYVELNPGRLPGKNTVGQEFSAIKSIIESTPEAAVLMTSNTILRDLRSVNAPLANTYDSTWERTYFPIAAQGESAFADFLEQNKVKYVLALQSERGVPIFEGFIQDYALFSFELSADRFEMIDKPVQSLLDSSRVIQLLKVKPGNSALRYSNPCVNTDIRFYPQTQIDPGSTLKISDDIWWILSDRQMIFPNFFGSQGCKENAFIHMDLVPALGPWATIQEVEVQTKFNRQVITLIPGETSTISIPIEYGPIVMTSKKECFVPSNNIPDNTDNRSLCFGIKRFWIDTSK